jgi:hypothetical protein
MTKTHTKKPPGAKDDREEALQFVISECLGFALHPGRFYQ